MDLKTIKKLCHFPSIQLLKDFYESSSTNKHKVRLTNVNIAQNIHEHCDTDMFLVYIANNTSKYHRYVNLFIREQQQVSFNLNAVPLKGFSEFENGINIIYSASNCLTGFYQGQLNGICRNAENGYISQSEIFYIPISIIFQNNLLKLEISKLSTFSKFEVNPLIKFEKILNRKDLSNEFIVEKIIEFVEPIIGINIFQDDNLDFNDSTYRKLNLTNSIKTLLNSRICGTKYIGANTPDNEFFDTRGKNQVTGNNYVNYEWICNNVLQSNKIVKTNFFFLETKDDERDPMYFSIDSENGVIEVNIKNYNHIYVEERINLILSNINVPVEEDVHG